MFPNPRAEKEIYIDALKLTESEFEAVKESTPESRIFLYKQEHESMLCRLDLSDLKEYIRVLSANTTSVKLVDELIEKYGSHPKQWLPAFFERSAL